MPDRSDTPSELGQEPDPDVAEDLVRERMLHELSRKAQGEPSSVDRATEALLRELLRSPMRVAYSGDEDNVQ